MSDKFQVVLKPDHRQFLEYLLTKRRCAATTLTRALILLKSDTSRSGRPRRDEQIARAVGVSPSTVYRVRKRFVEEGFPAALFPREKVQVR